MDFDLDTLQVEECAKRTTLKGIEREEVKCGHSIPGAYKEFLLACNGGHPKRCCFRWGRGAYRDSMVGTFFSAGGPLRMNLTHWCEVYADRLPAGFLPIASDPAGNLILLSNRGKTAGAVYFWDHEEQGRKALSKVASSFEAFLKALKDEEQKPGDWKCAKVIFTDGSFDSIQSTGLYVSLDRPTLVEVTDLRPGERVETFGNSFGGPARVTKTVKSVTIVE